MILEVQHETHLEYSEAVTEVTTEVRMEPRSDTGQTCHSFHLAVNPATPVFRYQDGFGNTVHHFNLLAARRQIHVLAACVVETHLRPRDLLSSQATYPLSLDGADLGVLDFLKFRGPIRHTPRL